MLKRILDEKQISKAADKKLLWSIKKVKELLDLRNSLLMIIIDCKKGCCSLDA